MRRRDLLVAAVGLAAGGSGCLDAVTVGPGGGDPDEATGTPTATPVPTTAGATPTAPTTDGTPQTPRTSETPDGPTGTPTAERCPDGTVPPAAVTLVRIDHPREWGRVRERVPGRLCVLNTATCRGTLVLDLRVRRGEVERVERAWGSVELPAEGQTCTDFQFPQPLPGDDVTFSIPALDTGERTIVYSED